MLSDTEIRNLLEARHTDLEQTRAATERELEAWRGSIADEPQESQEPAEVATDLVERERAYSVLRMAEAALGEVQEAFRRLDAGTYGPCVVCGKPIPEERLRARPEAQYCVEHAPRAED